MQRSLGQRLSVILCAFALAACAPAYSPNTYSGNAVQLANKVDSGVVVGFREVSISTNGTVGTVTGGAAGGLLGSEYANSALAAIGGTAVGAVVGSSIDHAAGDTTGWEYIIRKANGDMLSITQREKKPLAIGLKVLVINGPQARVVPDYSVASDTVPPTPPAKAVSDAKPQQPVKVEVVLSLPPGVSAQPVPTQAAPTPEPQSAAVSASAAPIPTPDDHEAAGVHAAVPGEEPIQSAP